jgi:hypothetical protein
VEVPEDLQAGASWPTWKEVEGEKGEKGETGRKVLVPEDLFLQLVEQVSQMGLETKDLKEMVKKQTVE